MTNKVPDSIYKAVEKFQDLLEKISSTGYQGEVVVKLNMSQGGVRKFNSGFNVQLEDQEDKMK